MGSHSAASSLTRRVTIVCGLWPLQIIGNPNRGVGLLARKGEHLRAVRTNGNPNRQGGIAVHGSSPIRALCVIPTAE